MSHSDNYQPDYFDFPDEEELTLAEQLQQETEWESYAEQYLEEENGN